MLYIGKFVVSNKKHSKTVVFEGIGSLIILKRYIHKGPFEDF